MCSPRCWATSTVRLSERLSIALFVRSSAVLISGSSAESNATSTTGPMTWTTRPIEFGDRSVVAICLTLESLGAADDLQQLLGDRRLTRAVVHERVLFDHVARALGRVLHRHHLGAEECSQRLE